MKVRVCNSDDPPEAEDLGICRIRTDFDYMEIRISSENWSSVIFEAWILQILLSEKLGVPTTVETGKGDVKLNFYDAENSFGGFSNGQDWGVLERASKLRDCRIANRSPDSDEYEPCAHFIPEVWDYSYRDDYKDYVDKEVVELPQGLGALVQEGWYIPRFTAERDSSLLSYLGLSGEDNRHKLAERFLRPTTWKDYCIDESPSNCTISDKFAQRPPLDEFENNRMYAEGFYTGYFRSTSQNDCATYPKNCTGHIVDYPFGWYSYIGPQTYHLEIALESNGEEPNSGGYSYDQMIEIWKAANATKSDVMMIWWQPDVLYQDFLDTEAEFMRVALPPPTQACSKSRIATDDRCSDDFLKRVGDSKGACDVEITNVHKVIASGLKDVSIDDGTHSPGYNTLSLFSITELQINEIFEYWSETGDPREAACQWVVDNEDFVNDLIPRTYPRMLQEGQHIDALQVVATVMASISILLVAWITSFVYQKRESTVMIFAQIEFLYLLLFGLLAIAIGAILVAIPPTDASCVASIWFINLGYTLALVPIIVKVAAINRLMNASKKMRRVQIQKKFLGGVVFSILGLVTVVLSLWTGLDPRKEKTEYQKTEEINENGETIVLAKHFCGSESVAYNYIFVAWTTILLFCATILAFQTRRIRKDFNESQPLAIMIYSHFLLLILRLIVLFQWDSLDKLNLQTWESLIYSFDVLATVLIYFVPKVMAVSRGRMPTASILSSRSSAVHFPHIGRTSSLYNTSTGGTSTCKHCGERIRLSARKNSGEQLPEQIESPDEEDDEQPKWCSAAFEVGKPLNEQEKIDKENKAGGRVSNYIDPGEAMNPDDPDRDPGDSDSDDNPTQKRRSSSKSFSKKSLTVSGSGDHSDAPVRHRLSISLKGTRQDDILDSLDDAIALIKGSEYDPPI